MTNPNEYVDVIGFEGLYKVNLLGEVYSTYRGGKIKKPNNIKGYMVFHFTKKGVCYSVSQHRLIAIHFIPNPKKLPQVNHIDGNKKNNSPHNLEWITEKNNVKHAIDNGLRKSFEGSKNIKSKLSTSDVLKIRHIGNSVSSTRLANQFGVSKVAIRNIINNKSWKHLSDELINKLNETK